MFFYSKGFIFYKFAYLDPGICLLYWIYAMTYYAIRTVGLSSQMIAYYKFL